MNYLTGTAALALVLGTVGCNGGDGFSGTSTQSDTVNPTAGTTVTATATATTGTGTDSGSGTTGSGSTSGTGSGSGSTSVTASGSGSTGGGMIPDPGDGMDDWISAGDIGTPATAWPVGTATQDFPYIEGTADANGNAFFVFEAGPGMTSITLRAFTNPNPDHAGLHEGAGGVFGAEIPPDVAEVDGGTWTIVPGEIYVFHLQFPGAQFF